MAISFFRTLRLPRGVGTERLKYLKNIKIHFSYEIDKKGIYVVMMSHS